MQIWWHSSDQVVVPLLFLLWSHFVQLFLSLSSRNRFLSLRKMSVKAHGSDCFGSERVTDLRFPNFANTFWGDRAGSELH